MSCIQSNCSFLGCFLAKQSTASSKHTIFQCMCNRVRPLSLSSAIVVRKKGFIRRRAEKLRSASQDVTGIVHIGKEPTVTFI